MEKIRRKTQTKRKLPLIKTLFVTMLATVALVAGGVTLAYGAAGQPPAHDKTASDNGDGTYTLELSVTGDADDETQEAGNVNILVIYDTSSSMTSNAQGSNYTRADQAEDVVHDFLTNLASYQNDAKDNINVALVTFARYTDQHNDGQTWTTDVTALANRFDDGGTDRQTNMSYSGNQSNGTNWESALIKANNLLASAPGGTSVPTFVIMMTDGAPTASGNGNNAINPSGATIAQLRNFYDAATEYAYAVAQACEATGGTFYGIYAYGTEGDLMDDLMYFSENNQHRGGNINNVVAATQDAPNFFRAADTSALDAAITEIFNEVVNALGISSVSISDGTTNQVETSTGVSELLEIDESSYQYWLSIPVVNNQFTRKMNVIEGGVSRVEEVTYTVTDNGDGTCTVNWTEAGSPKSVTVNGSVSSGNFKYEWTASNDLYKYAPPAAKLTDGSVDWNLSSVGTLLDGVTYSVTFKVYPSQETLDDVADIKNDPGENGAWKDLDPAVQQYIDVNGNLKTNTTATLTYSDTRLTNPGPTTTTFDNPDPVENSAIETLAVTKDWKNLLEDKWDKPTSVTLNVTRDNDPHYTVTLNDDNSWTDSVFISIGIMGADGKPLEGSEGHDFTFTEPEIQGGSFRWEIDAPTVHPMLINNVVTMLVKADADHPAPASATKYEFNGAIYYVDEAATSLTATNERRSSLNITKVVDGEDAPDDAIFPFTLNVVDSLAPSTAPSETEDPGHDSDYWIWISVWDANSTPVTEGAVESGATHAGNGWYYGASGEDIVLNVKKGYSIRVNNLPVGTTYTITEGTLPTGFVFDSSALSFVDGDEEAEWAFTPGQKSTGSIDTTNAVFLATFTNTYELVDINVDKIWDDADDQDGLRPEELTLTLNGAPQDIEVPEPEITKSEDGNTWTYTWKGLPKSDAAGEPIEYTVTEDEVPEGYTCDDPEAKDGESITNKHTPEVTTATVKKVWSDADNQDGKRPTSLVVTLNDEDETTVTLNESNEWTATVENLPKYAGGQAITYTWTEDEASLPEGYSLTDTSVSGTITTLTNSYTPETTTATVKKVWSDADDQDGKRPTSLEVTLSNGTKVTLNAENEWTATVENLPKNSGGQPITYTWTEDEASLPEGYELTDTSVSGTITTLTNSYTPETTEATVVKVWSDADDQDGIRPAALVVTLSNGATVTLSEDNEWTATVSDLPKYADGEEITYTWTEDEASLPEGYELTDTSVSGTITTLTNSYTPETTEATVVKVWSDADDQDGKRPTSLEVTLKAGNETVTTATLSEDNEWTATVENLPKNSDGQPITYTWTEDEASLPEGYTLSGQTKDGTVTTLTNSYTPETIEIEVQKIWEDADDQDGIRPDSVTVNLLANGEEAGTAVLSEDNEWTYTWTGLDKYAAGEVIEYTVEEVVPEGYEDSYDDTGYIITNTHTPEQIEITVTKVWVDGEDQDGLRPESVTIQLTIDDEAVEGKTIVLNEGNQWTNKFVALDKFKAGVEINYGIAELEVEGYEVAIEGETPTFEVTNTHTPEVIDITVTKTWDDADDKDGIRPESINAVLKGNGETVGTAVLNEGNGWTYTWTGLDKYAGGEEIGYTISEDPIPEGYTLEDGGDKTSGFTLKNIHTAKPDKVMSDPPVQKIVTGNPSKDETFTFQMKAVTEGAPMPEGSADGVKTVTITGTGSTEFGEMYYEEDGEWVYEISEVAGSAEGYTYDSTKYTLTVTVTEQKDGNQVKLIKTEKIEGGNGTIVFTNTYTEEEIPQTGDDLAKVVTPLGIVAAASGLLVLGLGVGRRMRKDR